MSKENDLFYYSFVITTTVISFIVLLSYFVIPSDSIGSSYTLCNDGTISQSRGPGSCSHHGGVDRYHDPEDVKIFNGFINMIYDMPSNIMKNNIGKTLFSILMAALFSLVSAIVLLMIFYSIFYGIRNFIQKK